MTCDALVRQAPGVRQHAAVHQADAEPGVATVRRACGRAEMEATAGEAIGLPAAAAPAVRLSELDLAVGAERMLRQVDSWVQPAERNVAHAPVTPPANIVSRPARLP